MALIQRINQVPGFQAELAKIDATPENFTKKYDVLVDRISHEVPFYRFHLKAAMLAGTYVINDPFWFSADDKFFGFSLATRIGVTVPRTVMLPPSSASMPRPRTKICDGASSCSSMPRVADLSRGPCGF
jgi:glutathione synthase/RimK-type ligase-like ATP-grasp enzyme